MSVAHATSAALPNGTMTLKSRMSVAGTGLPDFVEPPHRREDAARLRVHFDFVDALLQRGGDLRRELLEDDLAEVAAGGAEEADDRRVHHRLEDRDRVVAQPLLEHRRGHVRDAVAGEHAADGQHRQEEARDEQGDGHGEQGEDNQLVRFGMHIGCRT